MSLAAESLLHNVYYKTNYCSIRSKKVRTGRNPESLVRLAEFHREEGHERVHKVVSLAHQMEGGSEAQICWRHLVEIELL